jgi:hypothetical protein
MTGETRGALPPEADVWLLPARRTRVVDGDTVDLRVDQGFRIESTQRFRLYGVDTAEIYGVDAESVEYERGQAHTAFVQQWFDAALADHDADADDWPLRVYSLKDAGKFGRGIGDVVRESDGTSLVAALHEQFGAEVANEP